MSKTHEEFEWIGRYRNLWAGIATFADITSEQGKETTITVIERFDSTASAVFARAMPMVAVVAEVIALYAALSALLPWYITVLASMVLIMIPVVATRYMFLAPKDDQSTFLGLLVSYYVLAFALVFLLKVFLTTFTVASLAWFILPALSVLAVVLYGKTLSIELPEEIEAREMTEELQKLLTEQDDTIADLNNLLADAQRKINEQQQTFNNLQCDNNDLRNVNDTQRVDLQAQIDTLRNELTQADTKLAQGTSVRHNNKVAQGSTQARRKSLLQMLAQTCGKNDVNFTEWASPLGTTRQTVSNDFEWLKKNGYWTNGSEWCLTESGTQLLGLKE